MSQPRLAVVGEIAGTYSYTATAADIQRFVSKSAAHGVDKLVVAHYHSPTAEFPGYLRSGDSYLRIEPYQYGDGNPLAILRALAADAGMSVAPFANVATGGQWIRADYLSSGECWPYVRLIGGSVELDEHWTRTRDGRCWLDHGPRAAVGAYGYQSLAHEAVRARERRLYTDWVTEYGIEEVMLEFMVSRPPSYAINPSAQIPCCDVDNVWAYGYEAVSAERYREESGRDPREIPNSDPDWLRYRAGFATDHLRELRQAMKSASERATTSIFVFDGMLNSADDGMAVASDWRGWIDEGLIDAVYCRIPGELLPFRERFAPDRMRRMAANFDRIRREIGDSVELWPVLELPTYPLSIVDPLTSEEVSATIDAWSDLILGSGAERVGIWHYDFLELYDGWPAVRRLSRRLHS